MRVDIQLDYSRIGQIQQAAHAAAVEALEVVCTDLVNSKTIPFDKGNMQNDQTFVAVEGEDTINGEEIYSASIVTGSPQARRLYYHPEYNFQQKDGATGTRGAYWLEPYITGKKKDFVQAEFIEIFRRRAGL